MIAFVAAASGGPPPPLPFETMDWPASMKREPTSGVSLGTFRVTFESTTLRDVQQAALAGTVRHTGDAGGGINWLCYTAARRGGVDTIWIISHGEMGGPESSVTSFAASSLIKGTARSDCPPLPATLLPVSLDTHVWLGSTAADLQKRLGAASHTEGSWKAYNFQTKVPGDCTGGYDLLNWLFAESLAGHVSVLYAGQDTSC